MVLDHVMGVENVKRKAAASQQYLFTAILILKLVQYFTDMEKVVVVVVFHFLSQILILAE